MSFRTKGADKGWTTTKERIALQHAAIGLAKVVSETFDPDLGQTYVSEDVIFEDGLRLSVMISAVGVRKARRRKETGR